MAIDLFGEEPMRALSWKDPFGTLMLYGKIETRTWNTHYRGLVLICVAKQSYTHQQIINISGPTQPLRMWDYYGQMKGEAARHPGHAIAVGRLVDSRPMRLCDEDKCFVQHRSELWCHVYEEVRRIEPIAWRGKQGWANVSTEVRNQIKFI